MVVRKMIKGIIKNLLGTEFKIQLPKKYIHNDWITIGGVGSVIRQVHNQLKKNGEMTFDKLWVRSESYSGGNSVDIYLLNPTKETTELSDYIMNLFQYGQFNGMIDLYEYHKDGKVVLSLEDGTEIEVGSKYNSSYDKPPFGTKEYDELHSDNKKIGLDLNGEVITKKRFNELRKEEVKKIDLMKIIVSDEFNLLKDKNQSVDDYQKEKDLYREKLMRLN